MKLQTFFIIRVVDYKSNAKGENFKMAIAFLSVSSSDNETPILKKYVTHTENTKITANLVILR